MESLLIVPELRRYSTSEERIVATTIRFVGARQPPGRNWTSRAMPRVASGGRTLRIAKAHGLPAALLSCPGSRAGGTSTLLGFQHEGRRSVTVRELLRIIENDGWVMVAQKGSHRQYKHPTKPGRVTIAGHARDDIAPGTLNSILRQAGLKD